MSGREYHPDGTEAYHPDHPWEQVGHPLHLDPQERTKLNWPPVPAYPAGPYEAKEWDRLPVRIKARPEWRRLYGYAHPEPRRPLRCALGIHAYPRYVNAHTQAPALILCERCGKPK